LKRPGQRHHRADGPWLARADASAPDHLRRSRPRPHPSTEPALLRQGACPDGHAHCAAPRQAARQQQARCLGTWLANAVDSRSADPRTARFFGLRQGRRDMETGPPHPQHDRRTWSPRCLTRFSRSAPGPHLLPEGSRRVGSAGKACLVPGKAIRPREARSPRTGPPVQGRLRSAGAQTTQVIGKRPHASAQEAHAERPVAAERNPRMGKPKGASGACAAATPHRRNGFASGAKP